VLVGAAAVAAFIPLPASLVERAYSQGVFSAVQPAITSISNRTPASMLDIAIVIVAGAWVMLAARDLINLRPRPARAAARIAVRTVSWASAIYLVFLACWGFNYRRVPLRDKLAIADAPGSPEAVRSLALGAADSANTLYAAAHAADARSLAALERAFVAAARAVDASRRVVVARPKRALTLDWYFRRAAVSGMTDPIFLETLIASDVLQFERPMVVAHEWSHLAGLADEGDANFVGWLACIHGSDANRYSGWLFLYQELLAAAAHQDRAPIAAALGPGPRQDLRAARERLLRNVSPRVSAAGWRVYDSYLKANRVDAGAASYAGVVNLVVNTKFAADWTPVRR